MLHLSFFVPDLCVVYENINLELFPLLRLFQSSNTTISNYAVPDPIMMIQHSILLLLLLHCFVTFLLRSSQSLWAWWTASFVVFSSWSILSALSLASSFSFLSLKKNIKLDFIKCCPHLSQIQSRRHLSFCKSVLACRETGWE